jgi:hypothetical protein
MVALVPEGKRQDRLLKRVFLKNPEDEILTSSPVDFLMQFPSGNM